MAQFSDGPVEWPWCVQLVHGAHSSQCSHWCLAAFPGTRINAAPLGGQKWERVSNSNCRKARKSQGMTLDRQPSTTTAVAATTFQPLFPQADEALTWAAICPHSPPSAPSSPTRPTQIQRVQGKPNLEHQDHLIPLPPVAGVYSALARKNPECNIFPNNGAERSSSAQQRKRACNVRGMQVEEKKEERERRRSDGDVRRGETSSAVQCSIAQRTEERKREQRRAHKRSSLTGSGLDLRLHAH